MKIELLLQLIFAILLFFILIIKLIKYYNFENDKYEKEKIEKQNIIFNEIKNNSPFIPTNDKDYYKTIIDINNKRKYESIYIRDKGLFIPIIINNNETSYLLIPKKVILDILKDIIRT